MAKLTTIQDPKYHLELSHDEKQALAMLLSIMNHDQVISTMALYPPNHDHGKYYTLAGLINDIREAVQFKETLG